MDPIDAGEQIKPRIVAVVPARFVTIDLCALQTGLTPSAIRAYIHKGLWVEGRQWVKRAGRVLIDMKGYDSWAATEKA